MLFPFSVTITVSTVLCRKPDKLTLHCSGRSHYGWKHQYINSFLKLHITVICCGQGSRMCVCVCARYETGRVFGCDVCQVDMYLKVLCEAWETFERGDCDSHACTPVCVCAVCCGSWKGGLIKDLRFSVSLFEFPSLVLCLCACLLTRQLKN